MIVVMEALDGGLFDGSVHPCDLSISPGMLHFSEPMLDAVIVADPVEDVLEGGPIRGAVGEPDTIVGQDRVNGVRHRHDEIAQELGRVHLASFGIEFCECEFGRSINRHKQIELTLGGLHLRNVDVEIADRIAFELLLRQLVAFHIWQARNAVALQASMQR